MTGFDQNNMELHVEQINRRNRFDWRKSNYGSQSDLMISPSCWWEMLTPGDMIPNAGLDVRGHSCGDIRKILLSYTHI